MKKNQEQISLLDKNYAKALVQISDDGVMGLDEISEDLNKISEILDNSSDLSEILKNPTIDDKVKFEILSEVFSKDINNALINFLKILVNKGRFVDFKKIHTAFEVEVNKIKNIQPVTIVSAIDLTDEYKNQIVEKLGNKLNKSISPDWKVDKNIIAGLVVKVNDDVIDTSIKNKIDKISKELLNN